MGWIAYLNFLQNTTLEQGLISIIRNPNSNYFALALLSPKQAPTHSISLVSSLKHNIKQATTNKGYTKEQLNKV
jgi:hypothetical protein